MIVDASSMINLEKGNVLELALRHGILEASVEGLVYDECRMPDCLDSHVDSGFLTKVAEDEIDADEFFVLLRKYGLGGGETECIALANQSGCGIVCDDRKARAAATAEIGEANVTGSLGVLKALVNGGHLSSDQAHDAYILMRAKGAFLPEVSAIFFAPDQ